MRQLSGLRAKFLYYAALQVGERAKLTLSSGAYTFSAASFANDVEIELSGFVQIAVEGALSVGARVLMSTPAGAPASSDLIEWYTNARCPTLIDLQGSGAGNVTLRYWAQ